MNSDLLYIIHMLEKRGVKIIFLMLRSSLLSFSTNLTFV